MYLRILYDGTVAHTIILCEPLILSNRAMEKFVAMVGSLCVDRGTVLSVQVVDMEDGGQPVVRNEPLSFTVTSKERAIHLVARSAL